MTNDRSTETTALPAAALAALIRRFDDLERQNRRLKQAIIVAVVLLGAVGARAQGASAALTVDRLVLVDAQGRTRAALETTPAGVAAARQPQLTFLDAAGRPRLRVGLGPRGAILEVVDENGKAHDYFGPFTARPLTQD